MRGEKQIHVRFSTVGGPATKAEMQGIGAAGRAAMQGIVAGAAPASAGMEEVGTVTARARLLLEAMAVQATASAAAMRTTATAATPMVEQINRLTGVTPAIGQTTAEYLRQGQALDDLRSRYNPVFGVIRQYRSEVADIRAAHLTGALSADEMAAAIGRSRKEALASIAAYKGSTQAVAQMSRASRGGALRMQQMSFQMNDIAVSMAGGMNPFVVMMQQGTQLAQIYGFGNGGVSGALRDVKILLQGIGGTAAKLAARFWPLTAVIALGTAAISGLTHEINVAGGETVNFGDTALAIMQLVRDTIWEKVKPAVDAISGWFSDAWDLVVGGVHWAGNALINGIKVAVDGIKTAIGMIPDLFKEAWEGAKAYVFWALNDIVAQTGKMLEAVTSALNEAFGTNLTVPAGLWDAATALNKAGNDAHDASQAATGNLDAAWVEFKDRALATMGSDPMGDLFNAIMGRAQKNARIRKEKDKKDGASSEANAVDKLVASLQRELLVLRETDPVKKKMLEYSDQLAGATEAERQQVLGLVETLDRAQFGWEAVGRSLREYAQESKRLGDDIGKSLVEAFQGAEEAFRSFVKTGKFDFKSLVASILEDLAVLSFKRSVLGPLADGLSFIFGGGDFMDGLVSHNGGMVGAGGTHRQVPALAFVGAPRMHSGGWAGLKPDEVPAILQRGERVLSRREVASGARDASGGSVSISIDARGAQVGVAEQIDARLRAAIPEIKNIAKQAVADGRRRGHAL